MELMTCQMCGGRGCFTKSSREDIHEDAWAYCDICDSTGSKQSIWKSDSGMTAEEIETHLQRHDGLMPSALEAGRMWNRMQSLIAKGLLVEDEAAGSNSSKGRL